MLGWLVAQLAMLTMGVEGMEAHSPRTLSAALAAEGSAPLAEHRAPPAALQGEQQRLGSS